MTDHGTGVGHRSSHWSLSGRQHGNVPPHSHLVSPRSPPIRYVALVDGEHYPPVVEEALRGIAERGDVVVAAILVGGKEKLPEEALGSLADVPLITGDDPRALLDKILAERSAHRVVDLSDEPVLDYRRRHELAAVALYRGVGYVGADFEFRPPPRPQLATAPSLAIIGTGKRTGKTAVGGFAARTLVGRGIRPVVVSMGRGGPAEPEILRGDELELTPERLLELADQGRHAASDYVEDALLGRVTTIGCRRCGGGLAGGVEWTNFGRGIEQANGIGADLLLLEGSGSAIPPARADATILVMPASIPAEYVCGYMGPYRLLLADCVIVTMCENPFGSPSQISSLISEIEHSYRSAVGDGSGRKIEVVRTVFRPAPTRSVRGAKVVVATTAPEAAAESLRRHLEDEHGCRVIGISHALSDRTELKRNLESFERNADALLCEVKAAGIDVATRWALGHDLDVVYMDNVPHGVDGDDPAAAIVQTARLAKARFSEVAS